MGATFVNVCLCACSDKVARHVISNSVSLIPAALADSTGPTLSLSENVVCLPHVWSQRPAGLHPSGNSHSLALVNQICQAVSMLN